MPNITTKTFDQLVSDQVTAIQAKSTTKSGVIRLLDFAIGSVLRAIVESNSAVVLWVQGLLLQLLSMTRAATSSGTDLDSWGADFSFTRLPAVAATGNVTFSRYSPSGSQAVIPPGTQVQTSDAIPVIFTVTTDTGNAAWNDSLQGYVAAIGIPSVTVPVQCDTAGTVGNILHDQCTVLTGSLPGIDTVTNALGFTNGIDAEADAAFRARFVTYISSLSKATRNAIAAAIAGVQQGLSFTLVENHDATGAATPGYFYIVVDDGSGNPSQTLLDSVTNAVDSVRPFTTTPVVNGPTPNPADMAMTITTTNATGDIALVQAAISSYIAGLGVGDSLPYSRLAQIAYDASSTITNVTGVTLNGGTNDLSSTSSQRITANSIAVSHA